LAANAPRATSHGDGGQMRISNIHDRAINLMSMSWTWSQEAKYGLSGGEKFHTFLYVRRDILKSSMVNSMFGGISSERKFAIDVALIHKFTRPQQYHRAGLGKDGVCWFKKNVKTRHACTWISNT